MSRCVKPFQYFQSMFKLIHTSDWHLGQNFYGYDRSEEQRDFLRQLAGIASQQQPDAMLVSGDIFHTAAPSSAAVNMYVDAMLDIHDACPGMAIVVIAGNHDSASRLESDSRLWERAGVRVLGGICRNDEGCANLDRHIIQVGDKGIVAAVPFAYSAMFPQLPDGDAGRDERREAYFQALLDRTRQVNRHDVPVVLMAHLAVSHSDFTGHDNIMPMECVSIESLGTGYDYAALGHIHRPQWLDDRTRYCGTPLAVSFDEQCEHSVSLVEMDACGQRPRVTSLPIHNIKPLHTIPAGEPLPLEEALEALARHSDVANSYIRLNVLVDRFLPHGAVEQAARMVNDRGGRFCEIKRTATARVSGPRQQMSIQELSTRQPVEVAEQYFIHMTGKGMTPEEKAMFDYVFQLVQQDNRK